MECSVVEKCKFVFFHGLWAFELQCVAFLTNSGQISVRSCKVAVRNCSLSYLTLAVLKTATELAFCQKMPQVI